MQHSYTISGMTCEGCKSKVTSTLEALSGVDSVQIELESGRTLIQMNHHVSTTSMADALAAKGNYRIAEEKVEMPIEAIDDRSFLATYRPLFLIVGFIAGVSLLAQYPFQSFSEMLWMRYFMAGFFIVFSFFKFLNLEGFASAYRMYDIVAAWWKSWGYVYPFVELVLGIAYLINWNPQITNITTVVVLGVSTIGVVKSNLDKRKIQCACLGDVFDLPMSKVTIIEDVSMVAMAGFMLII